ncbi:MAG: Adaptive-response sensory-kinase SasA [Chloroflexi bacterium]|nr:Adaptive-response sensory-kinase SasA [Chloroflexota bacterium]
MVGYTDILLAESIGIIGTLQRQFLERIRASAERISVLLNTVIEEAAIDIDSLSLTPSAVNLSQAIDHSITEISDQIREKRISMRVDLTNKKLNLHMDQDSLHQILLILLKNASSATHPEGEILIRARDYDVRSEQEFALIQIADQGGGIPADELPRVFSHLYNNHASIEGVGVKGVELSIVKTLVEAQQGRIWADSEEDVGATFSLLLPLASGDRD